jgi:hypothetical protein
MSGWLTNGVPNLGFFTGLEQFPVDTQQVQGAAPESASVSLVQLAAVMSWMTNVASSTPTAGTRYYTSVVIGFPRLLTGIGALIGATGGTNSFIFELHDSTGALVATTNTSGVTVGTANTWQRIPFTAQYQAAAGTYYIAVQLNGTTARFATYNSPGVPLAVGSASGTFGTGAAITPPTTYTAGVGPMALVY